MQLLFMNCTEATKHMHKETYWPVYFYNKAKKRRFVFRIISMSFLLFAIIVLCFSDFSGMYPVFDGKFTFYDVTYIIICFVFTMCAVDYCTRPYFSAKRKMRSFGNVPPSFVFKFYDGFFSIFISPSNREEKVSYDDILSVKETRNYIIIIFSGPKYTVLKKDKFQGTDYKGALQFLAKKRFGI